MADENNNDEKRGPGRPKGPPTDVVSARIKLSEKLQLRALADRKYGGSMDKLLRLKGINEALMEANRLGIKRPKDEELEVGA